MQNILSSRCSPIFIDIIDHNKLTTEQIFHVSSFYPPPIIIIINLINQQTRNSFLTSLSLFTALPIIVIINFINQRNGRIIARKCSTVLASISEFWNSVAATRRRRVKKKNLTWGALYFLPEAVVIENPLSRLVGSSIRRAMDHLIVAEDQRQSEGIVALSISLRASTRNSHYKRLSLTFVQRDGSRAASLCPNYFLTQPIKGTGPHCHDGCYSLGLFEAA